MKLTIVFNILHLKFHCHKSEAKVEIFNISITPKKQKKQPIYIYLQKIKLYILEYIVYFEKNNSFDQV